MWRLLFVLTWGFIFLAAGYDAYFAWQYRAVLETWELNPVACWAGGQFGLPAVFGFKFGGLVYAAGLAVYCCRRHQRLQWPLTLVIAGAYASLSLHYVASLSQSDY
jgi:hypothetical protein